MINPKKVQKLHSRNLKNKRKNREKNWSDRGIEFYNETFLDFLKGQNIQIYSTNSDLKAIFVERFNRTLLDFFPRVI